MISKIISFHKKFALQYMYKTVILNKVSKVAKSYLRKARRYFVTEWPKVRHSLPLELTVLRTLVGCSNHLSYSGGLNYQTPTLFVLNNSGRFEFGASLFKANNGSLSRN